MGNYTKGMKLKIFSFNFKKITLPTNLKGAWNIQIERV